MLQLVETAKEKHKLQRELVRQMHDKLRTSDVRRLGFRGAGSEEHTVRHNGRIWFHSFLLEDAGERRYWNAFGIYKPGSDTLNVVVEINVPVDDNKQLVAGFFGVEVGSGDSYLLHSGKIGGGRPGIGKEAFLAGSDLELVAVQYSAGEKRSGIAVGLLGDKMLPASIENFVTQVEKFKAAAACVPSQAPRTTRIQSASVLRNPFDEGYGKREVPERAARSYYSWHGFVVTELKRALSEGCTKRGESLAKSQLVDLAIVRKRKLQDLFEVKTSVDRQSIYTAVGQLFIHSAGLVNVRRHLVIPQAPAFPQRLVSELRALGISVVAYTLTGGKHCTFSNLP